MEERWWVGRVEATDKCGLKFKFLHFLRLRNFIYFLQQQACNYLDFIEWVWVWSDLRL